jgi:glycerophosphoryl diester phosphodiesterase
VLDLVHARRLGDVVELQSFSRASLRRAHRIDRRVPMAQLFRPGASSRRLIAGLGRVSRYAQAIGPDAGSVDSLLVAAAHHHGLRVQPYTVNEPGEIERLLRCGVDGVITDVPDVASSVVARLCAPVAEVA